jgi:hypothetical protein
MKPLLLIALLAIFGCSEKQEAQGVPYESLSAAIVDGFLMKEDQNRPAFILVTPDKQSLYPGIRPSAVFNKTAQEVFKFSDSSELKTLLENSVFLDTTVKIASPNVRYVTRMPPEGYDWTTLHTERKLKDLLIVNFLVILTTKDGNQCVVYAHRIKRGGQTALLEKSENKWYIKSIQREQPETME